MFAFSILPAHQNSKSPLRICIFCMFFTLTSLIYFLNPKLSFLGFWDHSESDSDIDVDIGQLGKETTMKNKEDDDDFDFDFYD